MKRTNLLTSAMALGLVALYGCGRTPTSPLLDSNAVGQPDVSHAAVSPARDVPAPSALQPPFIAPVIEPGRSETSVTVNGQKGATIRVGRATVNIPKHAFTGKAQVTVTIPDASTMEVHLQISPAWKNDFAQPVALEFDTNECGSDPRYMQILWFDPSENGWVEIPCVVDAAARKVSAKLGHFSEYKAVCGLKQRSGW